MTGLKASTSAWKHMAKLWRWRYFGIRKHRDNQRDRLRQLEKSIAGVKAHNRKLTEKLEANEKELEDLRYTNGQLEIEISILESSSRTNVVK